MIFLSASLLLILLGLGIGFYLWRKERNYLKRKTSEEMSQRVWNEIVQEREMALKRRRTFHEALAKAKRK